jgi:hypothetical protein
LLNVARAFAVSRFDTVAIAEHPLRDSLVSAATIVSHHTMTTIGDDTLAMRMNDAHSQNSWMRVHRDDDGGGSAAEPDLRRNARGE